MRPLSSRAVTAVALALVMALGLPAAAQTADTATRAAGPHPGPLEARTHPLPEGVDALVVIRGGDQQLWFADFYNHRIGRMTASGATKVWDLPQVELADGRIVNAQPDGMAVGDDGAVWFAAVTGNYIGRMSKAGELTTYPLPSPGSRPTEMARGPDGALWFTERGGNRLGRITMDGEITEYALPLPSEPLGLVTGPDGAIWYTASLGNKIGRLDPATGAITEYPLTPFDGPVSPASRSRYPWEITVGPDGALWFTEFVGNGIGRITVDGQLSRVQLPAGTNIYSSNAPNVITLGPDGALWFTQQVPRLASRLDPMTLAVESVQVPGASPVGITAGPLADIWVAHRGGLTRVGVPRR